MTATRGFSFASISPSNISSGGHLSLFALTDSTKFFWYSQSINLSSVSTTNFASYSGGRQYSSVTLRYISPVPEGQRSRLYNVQVVSQAIVGDLGGIRTSLLFQVEPTQEAVSYQEGWIVHIVPASIFGSERWFLLYRISGVSSFSYNAITVADVVPFAWEVRGDAKVWLSSYKSYRYKYD